MIVKIENVPENMVGFQELLKLSDIEIRQHQPVLSLQRRRQPLPRDLLHAVVSHLVRQHVERLKLIPTFLQPAHGIHAPRAPRFDIKLHKNRFRNFATCQLGESAYDLLPSFGAFV